VIVGDFNRHDQLWGGDDVSWERQGEADPIIDLMNEHTLSSLLPRGTKTWEAGGYSSTLDLVLPRVRPRNPCCASHADLGLLEDGRPHIIRLWLFMLAILMADMLAGCLAHHNTGHLPCARALTPEACSTHLHSRMWPVGGTPVSFSRCWRGTVGEVRFASTPHSSPGRSCQHSTVGTDLQLTAQRVVCDHNACLPAISAAFLQSGSYFICNRGCHGGMAQS
jgi:hypothetical protein